MLKYLKNYSNLIKRVAIIALMVILAIHTICLYNYKSSYKEEVKSGLERQTELDSIQKQNEELTNNVSIQEQQLLDRDIKIQELENSIIELEEKNAQLEAKLSSKASTSSKSTTFKADGNYSQATQVWNGLKSLGLNDYVCAGIMGNIMAEVGGQTLDISRWSYYAQTNTKYYGICQWAGGRKQRLLNDFGTTLEAQIKFLGVELFEVIPKGNSFYNMQDEKQAALYFAKYYERCGSSSYGIRQSNATKALQYFTGK
jgi:hypothetical protein